MKNILIISYHSLPFDVIASYRANAYLRHFKKYGITPTLLTHFTGMEEQGEVVTEEYEYGNVIRVPIERTFWGRFFAFLESIPLINKLSILCRWVGGYLDPRSQDIDSYYSMKSYCFNQLDMNQFDLAVGIFSPHHHLRLCYKLHKTFKIPYVLDFRDLWHNRLLTDAINPICQKKSRIF